MASGDTLNVFTPLDNQPPATGYMTLVLRNLHFMLQATAASTDTGIFASVMPRIYAGGGITAYVTWCTVSATTGTVGWDITFERDSGLSNDDIVADHWATAQTITAVTVPGTSGLLVLGSVAITAGATGTASISAGNAFRVRVRNLAAGTAVGGVQFLSLELKET